VAGLANGSTAVTNSVSLFVFFDDGNAANNRDVVLFNGNDANFNNAFDADGWNMSFSGINYSGGSGFLRTYVSDGQNFGPTDDGTLTVNGTSIGSGGLFQGLSPNAPGAGVTNGSLGDIRIFDLTALLLLGPNTLTISMEPGFNDALSFVTAAIDLPAGAVVTNPVVPEPSTLVLVGLGLAVAARRARRRSKA
jgi:hypothetical protein